MPERPKEHCPRSAPCPGLTISLGLAFLLPSPTVGDLPGWAGGVREVFLKSVLSCSGSIGGWAPEVLGRVQGPEGLVLHRLWGRRVLPVLGRGLRVPGTAPCSALAWPRGDTGSFLLGAAAQPCSPFAPPVFVAAAY